MTSTPSERTPLLQKESVPMLRHKDTPRGVLGDDSARIWSSGPVHQKDHSGKAVFYDHDRLLTWSAVFSLSGNALNQRPVKWAVLFSVVVATLAAALVIVLVPDARKLNTKRFGNFLIFLKFFISFMLGIYVQQSFKRWQGTLGEFEKYLLSIKQMTFLFHSIHVSPDVLEEVQRCSIAASYIMNTEIHNLQMMDRDRLGYMRHTLSWLKQERLLDEDEFLQLGEVVEWKHRTKAFGTLAVSSTVWAWISEIVSTAKLEGGKQIAPPMHVRILALCQDCMNSLEELKMNVVTQVPYMYAQLLSFLVYANNFFLAVACGLTIGAATAEAHDRHEQLQRSGAEERSGHSGRVGELYEAVQTAGVQIVILLVEPMLYVAFLNLGHLLCYPFGHESYHLPTESFIARLHLDLLVLVDGRAWNKERRARNADELARLKLHAEA